MKRSVVRQVLFVSSAALVLALLLPIDGVGTRAQSRTVIVNGHEAVEGEALVKFRTPPRPGDLEQDADVDGIEAIGSHGVRRVHSRRLDAKGLIDSLRRRGDVLYAEPNYILHADAIPNDPSFGSLWGLVNIGQLIGQAGTPGADISADQAWTVTTGSRANVVGVVDTGVNYLHTDLAANIWSAPGSFTVTIGGKTIACAQGTHGFNAITKSCDPMDDNDHGTHVSGTIGAAGDNAIGIVGVNWVASIMGLKFLNAQGSGSTSDAINAIAFAIQAKQRFGAQANVRVLSNSWSGGAFSQALLDEITLAGSNGMLFVAAAGNGGTNNDATPVYPASYGAANLVAVAATDNKDNLASFSGYGATSVDLGAPGVNIYSTLRNGSYGYSSGTSMATPHVSGAAALTLAACGTLSTTQLRDALLANVDLLGSLSGKVATNGRLNVGKAVSYCAAQGPGADFGLSVAPASRTVAAGAGTTYSLSIAPINAYGGSPSFSVSGLPAGATGAFNPASSPSASTLTVTTTTATPAGSYTLTVRAQDNTLVHSQTVTLVVSSQQSPDFALSASPTTLSASRGSTTNIAVTIARIGGFSGAVALSLSGASNGVTGTFSPNPSSTGTATLTLNIANSARKGSRTLTITGISGSLSHTATVQLQVR